MSEQVSRNLLTGFIPLGIARGVSTTFTAPLVISRVAVRSVPADGAVSVICLMMADNELASELRVALRLALHGSLCLQSFSGKISGLAARSSTAEH